MASSKISLNLYRMDPIKEGMEVVVESTHLQKVTKRHKVVHILSHDFNRARHGGNDIAMLLLKDAIVRTDYASPVLLSFEPVTVGTRLKGCTIRFQFLIVKLRVSTNTHLFS